MEVTKPVEDTSNVQNTEVFKNEKANPQIIAEDKASAPIGQVIVLEDRDVEMDETNPDEIILNNIDVDRMDLNQELDADLQSESTVNQIFIGNLPLLIKKVNIVKFYEKYGEITDVKFIRSRNRKKTICFVTYEDSRSVLNALETNGLYYGGHNFRVTRVGRFPVAVNLTICVKNLAPETSYQDFYDTFEDCGPVKSQYLVKGDGQWCSCAYITFEFKESQTYAVLANNFNVNGSKVTVVAYNNHQECRGLSNKIL